MCATEVSTGSVGVTEAISMWSHEHLTVNIAVKVLASPNSFPTTCCRFLVSSVRMSSVAPVWGESRAEALMW